MSYLDLPEYTDCLHILPRWTKAERLAFTMAPKLTTSKWAGKFRVVSKGPSIGPWDSNMFPLLNDIMDARNEPSIEQVITTGPVQGGKTESSITNRILYECLYLGRDTMVLFPTANLAKTLWREKVLPAIINTPTLAVLLHKKHDRGSIEVGLRFKNGATLFMVGADSESALVSRSVETFLADESDFIPQPRADTADRMYQDKITQGIKRTDAYVMTRSLGMACTVTVEKGWIWIHILLGDRRTPWVKCPGCGEYIVLLWDGERIGGEVRGGFQFESGDEETIMKTARYECQRCGYEIRDVDNGGGDDRVMMNRSVRWLKGRPVYLEEHQGENVGDGEVISRLGTITGQKPRGKIASFWYNSLYVPWWPYSKLAAEQAAAEETPADKKDFQIHKKVIPWKDPDLQVDAINSAMIHAHCLPLERGIIPAEADIVVVCGDPHRRVLYWSAVAFKLSGFTAWLIDNGICETHFDDKAIQHKSADEKKKITPGELQAIYNSCSDMYSIANAGFNDGGKTPPVKVIGTGYDARYAKNAIARFVRSVGQGTNYAMMGHGTKKGQSVFRAPKWKNQAQPGELRGAHFYSTFEVDEGIITRILHIDSDWAKLQVIKGLQTPLNADGCFYLFRNPNKDYIKHLQAEEWAFNIQKGRSEFVEKSRNNHWLDATANCFVLAAIHGARMIAADAPARIEVAPSIQQIHRGAPVRTPGWDLGRRSSGGSWL